MDNQPLDNKQADNKKKATRLTMIVVLVVIGIGFLLVFLGVIKIPSNPLPVLKKQATVNLKSEYKNPFKKETQYVNPFDTYKNPFVVNR